MHRTILTQGVWIERTCTHTCPFFMLFIVHCIYFYYITYSIHYTMHKYILRKVWCTQYMNIKAYWSHNTGDTQKHQWCTIHIDTIVSDYSWWGRREEVREWKRGVSSIVYATVTVNCDETSVEARIHCHWKRIVTM